MELQSIYLEKISEAVGRLDASFVFLKDFNSSNSIYSLESSILQLRKAFEAIAFASISPNKIKYENLRLQADKNPDFRKDYNARKIMGLLTSINKDFYPIPIHPATRQVDGSWHYERKTSGFLTKKQFESFYDRLGKFLHADNPWGNDKGVYNIVNEMPKAIHDLRSLLELHFTVIRTPSFNGVWIVEVPISGIVKPIIVGQADGDFILT